MSAFWVQNKCEELGYHILSAYTGCLFYITTVMSVICREVSTGCVTAALSLSYGEVYCFVVPRRSFAAGKLWEVGPAARASERGPRQLCDWQLNSQSAASSTTTRFLQPIIFAQFCDVGDGFARAAHSGYKTPDNKGTLVVEVSEMTQWRKPREKEL